MRIKFTCNTHATDNKTWFVFPARTYLHAWWDGYSIEGYNDDFKLRLRRVLKCN